MKALSLWQPYATLMASSLKWNETRNRVTHYRGDLAICSAQRNWLPGEFGWDLEWIVRRLEKAWWAANKIKPAAKREALFPKGYVVCVVEVTDCQPTDGLDVSPLEQMVGDYSPGRFAWITRNNRPLKKPVPVIGRQGVFNLPPEVEAQVRAQL